MDTRHRLSLVSLVRMAWRLLKLAALPLRRQALRGPLLREPPATVTFSGELPLLEELHER